MEKIEQFDYEKLNYQRYLKKIQDILKNDELQQLGIQYSSLTKTDYNYPVDCLTVGNGNKELFIVGGTHGSEIIGVDFILNYINQLSNFQEFDPNKLKLVFVPLQNPEGFDVSSNTLKIIDDSEFNAKSQEYYKSYRTDSIAHFAIQELNLLFNKVENDMTMNPVNFLDELKNLVNNNARWIQLKDNRAIPGLQIFIDLVNSIDKVNDYTELRNSLLFCCNQTLEKAKSNLLQDSFLATFISIIKSGLSDDNNWKRIENIQLTKNYQQMFKNSDFQGIASNKLKEKIEILYDEYDLPKGSQISFDPNGNLVNLNANNPLNAGIESIKSDKVVYSTSTKSNLRNYFPGPVGLSTRDIYNFSYEKENLALERLLKESMENGRYLSTFLYHGTGGMIYYKPYQEAMDESNYNKFIDFNSELAQIYSDKTGYKLLDESSLGGYGDYLRRTYPGVLLIELSKMGGNPIAPYGDMNNIYNVFNDNMNALNEIIKYFQNQISLSDDYSR